MTIRFLDPQPPVRATTGAYAAGTGGAGERPVIGLLANGFPDSAAFLDALAGELVGRLPGATFVRVTKLSPPTPLTDEQIHALGDSCHAVIAAYGH